MYEYEAAPPPPPPPAATARFVPVAPGDTTPAFPMLGTNIETPLIGYSRVLLASLPKFEKETEAESETLEASPSESSDVMTLTPIFGVLHLPSSDRRRISKSNHFLQPKAKTFDELINEATKA